MPLKLTDKLIAFRNNVHPITFSEVLGLFIPNSISQDAKNLVKLGSDNKILLDRKGTVDLDHPLITREINPVKSGFILSTESTGYLLITFPDLGVATKFNNHTFVLNVQLLSYRGGVLDLVISGFLRKSDNTLNGLTAHSRTDSQQLYTDIRIKGGIHSVSGLPVILIDVENYNNTYKWSSSKGGITSAIIANSSVALTEVDAWDEGWVVDIVPSDSVITETTTKVEILKHTYRTDSEISIIARAGLGTLNPNPTFVLGKSDYKNWLNTNTDYDVVEDEVNGTAGSLYLKTQVYPQTYNSDYFYPVDMSKQYRGRVSLKLKVSGVEYNPNNQYYSKFYWGVTCYDSDKNIIMPQQLSRQTGTQTYLAQDLNISDTTIVVDDASSWYTGTQDHRHSILMHRKQPDGKQQYVGVNGRKYDDLGYSRWNMYYGYNSGASNIVDNGNGTWTITLKSPWTLGNFVVGDAIRNSYGGGTYNYWISSLVVNANTGAWQDYSTTWQDGKNADQYDYSQKFRNGTAFVKAMSLPNYTLNERTPDGSGGWNGWVSLGHTTDGSGSTKNIFRELWMSTLALDWRWKP